MLDKLNSGRYRFQISAVFFAKIDGIGKHLLINLNQIFNKNIGEFYHQCILLEGIERGVSSRIIV